MLESIHIYYFFLRVYVQDQSLFQLKTQTSSYDKFLGIFWKTTFWQDQGTLMMTYW